MKHGDRYEFFNGVEYVSGKDGAEQAQPLFTFLNKTGTVTASYILILNEYLMVISTASFLGVGSIVKVFD